MSDDARDLYLKHLAESLRARQLGGTGRPDEVRRAHEAEDRALPRLLAGADEDREREERERAEAIEAPRRVRRKRGRRK